MDDRLRAYSIATGFLCAVAAVITFVVWLRLPVEGNPWHSAIQFIILISAAELLAVRLNEYEGVSVSPTSPILWAATCVLGVLPAIVVGVVSAAVSMVFKCVAFHAHARLCGDRLCSKQGWIGAAYRFLEEIGATWQARAPSIAAMYFCWYVACIVADVGPGGLVYHWLGGRFLINAGGDFQVVTNFILPFVALVAVSAGAHVAEYAIGTAAVDPIPGTKGLYGVLLRMRLAVIETALPIVKGQIVLSVVALLLAYLYARIGVLGFILAIAPVLALRDFFAHWVREREAYLNTIATLATYMQHYHPYTRGHLKRVAELSERIARELRLPAESIRYMKVAGLLHDIGKIGVSEEILDKPSQLTEEEWAQIKEHPVKGAEIISHLDFLEGIVDWIKYHHKWYNGAGYPVGNGNGSKIPIEAAIIAAADAFDAMTDDREMSLEWTCDSCSYKPPDGSRPRVCPRCGAEKRRRYREPKTLDQAMDELRRGAGTQFDPRVVKAFLAMVERDGIKL
ncbi:MAG: HD domain-containing protein, partial [Armatimonadota bacterium]|nr:HD domain-containing protein [Armatimonadota bacterium]